MDCEPQKSKDDHPDHDFETADPAHLASDIINPIPLVPTMISAAIKARQP